MTEWHHDQPQRRRSRVFAPINLETAEGAPLSILPGECEIEERGDEVRLVIATATHKIATRSTADAMARWLEERRISFLSWR